jgi:hypothetical protein
MLGALSALGAPLLALVSEETGYYTMGLLGGIVLCLVALTAAFQLRGRHNPVPMGAALDAW